MQQTIAEGRVILSKLWHKFKETNEDLSQEYEGVFIKAGQKLYRDCQILLIFRICVEL